MLELCKDQGRKEAGDELPVKEKLFSKRSKSEMMISSEVGDELSGMEEFFSTAIKVIDIVYISHAVQLQPKKKQKKKNIIHQLSSSSSYHSQHQDHNLDP